MNPDQVSRSDNRAVPELYRGRLWQVRREGGKILQHGTVPVKYSTNFEKFADAAAYSLRRYIKYRSDGGKFARGLVRQTPHLRAIHEEYRGMGHGEGEPARLYAILIRRQHSVAEQRRALKVEFYMTETTMDFSEDEEFDVDVASPEAMKTGIDAFFTRAIGLAEDVPGKRGDRMVKYLELAERLGYPKCLDLWYYDARAVREYRVTSDAGRAKMTRATHGRLPFEGALAGFQYPVNWRIYPFRWNELVAHANTTDREIERGLVALDAGIIESVKKLTDGPTMAGSQTANSRLWIAFRQHVGKLMQQDSSHLYYMWNRYPGYELK